MTSSSDGLDAGTAAMQTHAQTVIFTVCSVNYLGKAVAMCRSARDHHPEVDLVILVADRKRELAVGDAGLRILWAEDIGFPDYLQCAFKYNIIEFNTALKPHAAQRLLDDYRKVVYLDPDVCVFSPLNFIDAELEQHSTLLTPHALSPFEGDARPSDQDLLRFGCFNLGFFAVRATDEARRLLRWWHGQCLERCFYEPQAGLGVDQKWMDLAAAFFEGVHILRDPGLNVAFWNLHERALSHGDAGWRVNHRWALGFVHFSSFVESDRTVVADKQTRHAPGSRPDFSAAGDVYRSYLAASRDTISAPNSSYGYAEFDDGSAISPALRRFYALHKAERFAGVADPFASQGPVHAFARCNGLLTRRRAVVAHTNFKAQSGYAGQQRVITFMFRCMLRLLGPDRYFLLLRYLSHYASIFSQTDLLKK